jgi:hypothetical protein
MNSTNKTKPVLKLHKPAKAPKVPIPKPLDTNYMKEAGLATRKGGAIPMKRKRLSK